VSDDRLGEPRTNRELFTLLESAGWVSHDLSRTLRAMAGFRNVLVHGYDVVNVAVCEICWTTGWATWSCSSK
jgi:uncharacterized protein YutE (UPF0331/DUF86 family)